jgi:hypothetical protein
VNSATKTIAAGLSVSETADTVKPVIQSAAIQFGTGLMQLTMSETVDISPLTHIDLTQLFINQTRHWSTSPHQQSTTVFNDFIRIPVIPEYSYEEPSTVVASVDGNTLFLQLPELIRVKAIVSSNVPGGDGSKTLVDAFAGLLFDIGLNENIETLAIDVTETADLIVPTLQQAKIFYDQPAMLQLTFSETIDVFPANLIDKTRMKLVDYQGQTTGSVSLVDGTQSDIQGLVVNFTLTEAQRVATILFSGTPGGDGYHIWVLTVTSQPINEDSGVVVSQANGEMTWTFTITSQTFVAIGQGVAVTQTSNSATGTLTYALTGATTTLTVTSAVGQVFDKAADLVIGGSTAVVASTALLDVQYISTPNAVGTLEVTLSGAETSIAIRTQQST